MPFLGRLRELPMRLAVHRGPCLRGARQATALSPVPRGLTLADPLHAWENRSSCSGALFVAEFGGTGLQHLSRERSGVLFHSCGSACLRDLSWWDALGHCAVCTTSQEAYCPELRTAHTLAT